MTTTGEWRAQVRQRARETGADLPAHTVDELAAHLEDLYLDALAHGHTEREARAAAAAALAESPLGAVPRSRVRPPEAAPQAPGRPGLRGVVGDLRFAWRQVRRAPSFAVVAIATLGLGAGAATAIFSILDTVLLRPLPYRDPQAIVALWDVNAERGLPRERLSPVTFMDDRALPQVFSDAAAWWRPEVNLAHPGVNPIRVSAVETSGNLFDLLGVSPELGPGFPSGGPFYSRDPIAVISDRLWRTHYGADPTIIGKQLDSDGGYVIVGVMPPRFTFPDDVDVWLRLNWDLTHHSRGAHFMEAVARLRPGATVDMAARELTRLSGRLASAYPATNRGWTVRPVPLLDDMLGYYRPALIVVSAAVVLLLLTACLNVASLLLARATTRTREFAIRGALGATRLRLVRQLLVESLALAAAGTLVGAVAARVVLRGAIAALPASIPRLAETHVDVRLLGFSLALIAVTAVLFGVLPSLVLARANAADALSDGSRGASGYRGRRWNQVLVVTEVALACAVLLGSGLLIRSVSRMLAAPLGVATGHVVTATVQVPSSGYKDWAKVDQFYDAFLAAVRTRPGVQAAGATTDLPLDAGWRLAYLIRGEAAPRPGDERMAQHVSVTSGYFETMQATLRAGRLFDSRDTTDAEPVIVVNETFARQTWPGRDAVGQQILTTVHNIGPLGMNLRGPGPFRVIGVVADVRQTPLAQAMEPVIYFTARQFPFRALTVVARGSDAPAVMAALRSALSSLDASLPLANVQTMDERLLATTAAPRLLMGVLSAFAVLTAALAAIGVYGLLAWVVNTRRRELAIRLALGAQPVGLAAIVTAHGLALTAGGVVLGIVVAQLAGGLLRSVLFETRTTDALAVAGSAAVLLLAGVLACVAPARRAASVAPADGLKLE